MLQELIKTTTIIECENSINPTRTTLLLEMLDLQGLLPASIRNLPKPLARLAPSRLSSVGHRRNSYCLVLPHDDGHLSSALTCSQHCFSFSNPSLATETGISVIRTPVGSAGTFSE